MCLIDFFGVGFEILKLFMGSERVFGGVGVRQLEAGRESERTPVDKSKSHIQRDGTSDVADPKSASWGLLSSASYKRQGSYSLELRVENGIELASFSQGSPIRLVSSRSGDLQSSSKCKKLSKNGSGCSKRQRLAQMVDPHNLDKCRIPKQRENCAGKQTDKRTQKVLTRAKYDTSSPKNGMTIFNSSSAGHNVLGYYGLKPDLHDITKQVNELFLTEHSLEELLNDTFTCQEVGKTQESNLSDTNKNIVQSIQKVCSILLSQRPSQLPASSELEGNLIKLGSAVIASASSISGTVVHDRRDSTVIDQLPQNKESCSCLERPVNTLDTPLQHPNAVLKCLGQQPAKNLDSLLSGDARPILSVRDGSDARLGKRLVTQHYLPAFSWSHNFGGNCKSTSDAVKQSTSRSLCQGSRWAKIGHTAGFCGVMSNDFTDFTKFSFNPNLVPQGELISVILASGDDGHLPDPTLAASDSRTANFNLDEHPASLTAAAAAAQTLCKLATQSFPPDLRQLLRWPRKPQDKAVKGQSQTPKYEERSERQFSRPKSLLGYDSMARGTNNATPSSKKAKLTPADKKKDATSVNGMAKDPLIWSGPKSCRSSSYKSIKDPKSENKYRSSDLSKPTIGLPPVMMLDKGSNRPQKPRKVVPVYWDR